MKRNLNKGNILKLTDKSEVSSKKPNKKYKVLERFNNLSSIEYSTRLNNTLLHTLSSINEFNEKGNRHVRLRCILYFYKCVNGDKKKHIRVGRVTSRLCPICKVVLCKHCFDTFQTKPKLELPKCVNNH